LNVASTAAKTPVAEIDEHQRVCRLPVNGHLGAVERATPHGNESRV